MKEKIIELLNNMDCTDLVNIHREYCSQTNCFDDEIFSMDTFDEVFNDSDPWNIACRIFYGEFNPNDDYFTFNGYGNLVSLSEYNIGEYVYIDDIADYIIDNNNSLYNDEVQEILDEFEGEEDEEDEEE